MLYWLILRKIRIKEQKKLDKNNLKVFKKISEYIKNSNLKYFEKEEALHQIMDTILQSQAEHKSIDAIIEDYEFFCKSIVEEYTKDKSSVYTVVHYFQRVIMSMLVFLVPVVVFFKIFYPKKNTGINSYIFTFAIGCAFILKFFTHSKKQRVWATVIYLIFMLWTNSFFTETKWGLIIDNILIKNTNAILLGMLLIIVGTEIYKKVCERKMY